jgi:hypothetical protein
MEYTYHCQHQAESFANSILAVPDDYPLKKGLPKDFRVHFAKLCELAKDIYMDMAKQPEVYGVKLLDINSTDHNLAREGYRTIHRFADTLNALFLSGEVTGHCLHVDAARFREAVRSLPLVPKVGLVLSRLCEFGFAVSDFNGTMIDKKSESFAVKYPDYPDLIDTIKVYCDTWKELDRFRDPRKLAPRNELIKFSPQEFHHRFYRFDYKITADLAQIPMRTWVADDADGQGFSPELKQFALSFFDASHKYGGLRFDGEYHFKSKRIARITLVNYAALGKPDYRLSLKLPGLDKYMNAIETMPESIKEHFTKNYCNHCNFQGATPRHCKFRLHWTYDAQSHEGCAYWCFNFTDFDTALVPDYWRLLELEYGLSKV